MRLIRVLTPRLAADRRLVCCGSTPELGEWNPLNALPMHRNGIPLWTVEAEMPEGTEYKFVILNGDDPLWEEGPNRTAADPGPLEFRGLERWRAAGVAVPVFSLRSEADCGCGDFEDIKLLVDWAVSTGQQLIQILPINDTTLTRTRADSYPYSAISSFALHPLYLRPQLLGSLPSEAARREFEKERQRLNAAEAVDYPAVVGLKEAYARAIFKKKGAADTRTQEFADFLAANAEWLLPYCAFSVLRDANRNEPYSPGLVARLALENTDGNFMFYAWLQFQLHCQLLDACNYARSRGIALKGDIPIGVSPHSVDAWQHPELFNLDSSAGAPPDAFAADGQNWGFPTYNWERMALDGFRWWRRRLEAMAQYFDAFRIDHILGFFRIWEIPAGVNSGLLGHFSPALPLTPDEMARDFGFRFEPWMTRASADTPTDLLFVEDPRKSGYFHPRIMGYDAPMFSRLTPEAQDAFRRLHEDFFYHRHNDFWRDSALRKLPDLVNATPMLACAEDLGMIPGCVPEVLASQRILALEVQRMPKEFGVAIANPATYGWMNVATTSTHDMPPLRMWLRRQQTKDTPEVCMEFINDHMQSPAMLAVLPIQDWLSISRELRRNSPTEEQINIPADPAHYWRYRLHIPLESIIQSSTFRNAVAGLTTQR